MPSRAAAHANRDAFTLVEVVTALTLMAILAAIAIPRYSSSLANYRADLAARRLAADIALCQSTARGQSTSKGVEFDTGRNAYALKGVAPLDGRSGMYTVYLSDAPHHAKLSTLAFDRTTPDSTVLFDGFGVPDRGLTVTIRSGSAVRTVTVDPDTGVASVQ